MLPGSGHRAGVPLPSCHWSSATALRASGRTATDEPPRTNRHGKENTDNCTDNCTDTHGDCMVSHVEAADTMIAPAAVSARRKSFRRSGTQCFKKKAQASRRGTLSGSWIALAVVRAVLRALSVRVRVPCRGSCRGSSVAVAVAVAVASRGAEGTCPRLQAQPPLLSGRVKLGGQCPLDEQVTTAGTQALLEVPPARIADEELVADAR